IWRERKPHIRSNPTGPPTTEWVVMPPASLSAKPLMSPGPRAPRNATRGSRERTNQRTYGRRPLGARRRGARGFLFNMDLSVSSRRAGANLPVTFSGTKELMPEPRTLPLVVASIEDITPHMRRIQLTGSSLETFEYFTGQDLALPVGRDDGSVVRRRYTIRRFDRGQRLIDLEFVMHGDGPGIRWAQTARPCVAIEAIGPRGKIGLNPNAKSHLFAGDATAVPGAWAMIEALPAGVPASAFLMVGDPAERQSFDFGDTMKKVEWRYESAIETPDGILAAVSAFATSP